MVQFSETKDSPRVYKLQILLRPIVASKSPKYQLAEYLFCLLHTALQEGDYSPKGFVPIIKRIKDLKSNSEKTMVWFDVISLFTNIPTKKLRHLIQNNHDLPQDDHDANEDYNESGGLVLRDASTVRRENIQTNKKHDDGISTFRSARRCSDETIWNQSIRNPPASSVDQMRGRHTCGAW